jgi:hypothetical protein
MWPQKHVGHTEAWVTFLCAQRYIWNPDRMWTFSGNQIVYYVAVVRCKCCDCYANWRVQEECFPEHMGLTRVLK